MPAAEAAALLRDDEVASLFAPLTGACRIALAVSGGADSLALLDCADRWRKERDVEVGVLTVDHRLCEGSTEAAADVAALAGERGLPVRILTWTGPHPRSGVEAAAREARYRLMLAAAREIGASYLLLAHHREDQAETVLMRLKRKAGLFGLAAMRSVIDVGGIVLFRPFLAVPQARLRATTRAADLVPADDPMNHDPRFERVRLRRLLPALAGAAAVDAARLAALAERCAAAAASVDRAADEVIAEAVSVDTCAVAHLVPAGFRAAPTEVRLRVLVRLLIAVGGSAYPPRSARLAALASAMAAHRGNGHFKRTLAATVVEWRAGRFLFYREVGRAKVLPVCVESAGSRDWDRRFRIDVVGRVPAGLSLTALCEAGRRSIGARAGAVPAGALAALPAIRQGAEILAVPAIGYRAKGFFGPTVAARSIVAERLARPLLFPDLAG